MSGSAMVVAEEQWLRSEILPKMLKSGKLVEKSIEEESNAADVFKDCDIRISFIGPEEAFMLTICYRASITFDYKGEINTCHIVVKKTPSLPPQVFDEINFGSLFSNEIAAYTVILPAIEKFTKTPYKVPKYYYSELRSGFATIFLEDFTKSGWRMAKDKVNLSLGHIMLAVKYLGNFHGICFAMRQTNRQLFGDLTNLLKDSRFGTETIQTDWDQTQKASTFRVLKAARTHQPAVSEEFLEKLGELLKDPYKFSKKRVEPVEPFVTLCHGDYLRNNVAYNYGDLSDNKNDIGSAEPKAVMMFDLQTLRAGSPMIDLTVFMGLSTFSAVRWKHFDELFSAYCESLRDSYEKHANVALPEYLSRASLLQEYTRFLPYSLSIAAFFLGMLIEPMDMGSEDFLQNTRSEEEIFEDTMTRGGEVVDRELAHQVKELFDLCLQTQIDISKVLVS